MRSTNEPKPVSLAKSDEEYARAQRATPQRRFDALGWLILVAAVAFLGFGLLRFWLKPLLTQRLPDHPAQPVDSPPLELTSFAIRLDGIDQTPIGLAASGDSIYVSLRGSNAIQIYSGDLELLRTIRLTEPSAIQPTGIALSDSLLIVADATSGSLMLLDREGDYLESASLYPDRQLRLHPSGLFADLESAIVADTVNHLVAVISLVQREPFAEVLELLDAVPFAEADIAQLGMAVSDPSGKLWIGDSGRGQIRIFDRSTRTVTTAETPTRTRIVNPVAATFGPDGARLHIVDKGSGKVLVYDLDGKLVLVYPQNRSLAAPTAIAINAVRRTILVTESQPAVITVFGY